MTDVFISYAREDRPFVQRLHEALAGDGHQSWVDWEGIPASAKWMAEVRAAIDEAECFCFVVSPDSVESPVCREEAAHAAASNKRIVPLLHRDVSDGLVPETVAAHNWIEFREGDDFDRAFATLARALRTEPEHLRTHTRLLVRAKEWDGSRRDGSFVLRGADLTAAEAWLGSAAGKEPAPTQLHTAYVLASRRAANRRQRATIGAVAAALVVSLVLSAVALVQRSEARDAQAFAERQRDRAEAQTAVANSRALAVAALSEMDTRFDVAALLSVQAYTIAPTPESLDALRLATQRSRSVVAMLRGHEGLVRRVAFSADGRILASAGDDGSVVLWDTSSWSPIGEPLVGHEAEVLALAFSPDGAVLASAGVDDTVILWDPATGRAMGEPLEGEPGRASVTLALAFSPDGRRLAVGSGPWVLVWDPATHELVERVPIGDRGHADQITGLAYSPDGGMLAVTGGSGNVLLRLDTATWRPVGAPVEAHADTVSGVTFDPDGRLIASSSWDGTASVWDARSGDRVAELDGHTGRVYGVAFAPDGRTLVTSGEDATLIAWDTGSWRQLGQPLRVHADAVDGVAFASDGSLLASAGYDGTVVVWDPRTANLAAYPEDARDVLFAGDGVLVSAGGDGDVIRWDRETGAPVGPRIHHADVTGSLATTAGMIAVGVWDGTVVVRDATSGRLLAGPLDAGNGLVDAVAFSPDGALLAAGGTGGNVVIWDTDSWAKVGEPLRMHDDAPVSGLSFSPNGDRLAVATWDGVALWDHRTGAVTAELLAGHDAIVNTVAFSPDGALVAAGTFDPFVFVWETATGDVVAELRDGHTAFVRDLSFTPDGSTLATASDDGTVVLWDVSARAPLGLPLDGHRGGGVLSLVFAPGGDVLVSGGADGTLALWDQALWSEDVRAVATRLCTIVGRNLTTEEWGSLVPFLEPVETCPVVS